MDGLDVDVIRREDRRIIEEARQFRHRAFKQSGTSLVPMGMSRGGHGAWPGPTIDGSSVTRRQFLIAKDALLRQMLALKSVLPKS